MEKFGSNTQLQAIIVGSSSDGFVRYAADLLTDYEVDFVCCGDVYSAVSELAKGNYDGNVLVIGRFEQLSREGGRFFQKVSENGLACCCLAEWNFARKRKQILAAIETGAFIINEPAEIAEVVTKLPGGSSISLPGRKENNRTSAFIKDEFLTTKAEIDALLGT
jgi:hypothetical protein